MNSRLPGVNRSTLIIGGGLSGLATAYFLEMARGAGAKVSYSVLEGSERWGGKILTEREGGFLLEGGSDSFITRKPWALELIREVGLGDAVEETPADRGSVYVLRQERLVKLPRGMMFIIPTNIGTFLGSELLPWAGKLRMLREMLWSRRRPVGEESLADFVRRRFGQAALAGIAEPLMAGIHAADPETLSLDAAFPEIARADKTFPSLIRGLRAAHAHGRMPAGANTQNSSRATLRGGLSTLVSALVERLDPAALHLGTAVEGIEGSAGNFRVRIGGEERRADSIVVATPSHVAAELVRGVAPEVAAGLASIRAAASATVNLGFRAQDVGRPLDGLGFVVPHAEGRQIRACTWSSAKFSNRAPAGHVLLRVFVGGAFAEPLVDLPDEAMVRLALEELRPLMKLTGEPILTRIHRWPQGIPQQEVGHLKKVAAIEAACPPGLYLAGNAYHGVGLPDCVLSGRRAAEGVLTGADADRKNPG